MPTETAADRPPMPAHDYAEQWARDTLSGKADGTRFEWGERNLARAYLDLFRQVNPTQEAAAMSNPETAGLIASVRDAPPAARDAIMRAHLDASAPVQRNQWKREAMPVECELCGWRGKRIVARSAPCPNCGSGKVQYRD